MGCISAAGNDSQGSSRPTDPWRTAVGAPTPRMEIRGHQLLGRPYRRFDTLRSPSPAQPYFHHTLALLGVLAHHNVHAGHTVRSEKCKPLGRRLQDAGRGTHDAREHGRPFRPVASDTRRERAQPTSHKTHMAWAVTCHLLPVHPPQLLVLPPADHHSPWRLSPHAVSPSASVPVRAR